MTVSIPASASAGRDWLAEIQPANRGAPPSDIVAEGLAATGRVRFAWPDVTFYLFCAVDGGPDSRALAPRLVGEAGVGVAPSLSRRPPPLVCTAQFS
jgi:aspartate/methionine/tyrosine aminotransferase